MERLVDTAGVVGGTVEGIAGEGDAGVERLGMSLLGCSGTEGLSETERSAVVDAGRIVVEARGTSSMGDGGGGGCRLR